MDENKTPAPSEDPAELPMPDFDSHVKIDLNTLIWEHARKDVTLGEMEEAACKAFEAIWPLCERKD